LGEVWGEDGRNDGWRKTKGKKNEMYVGLLLSLPLIYKLLDGLSLSLLSVPWRLGFLRSMYEKGC